MLRSFLTFDTHAVGMPPLWAQFIIRLARFTGCHRAAQRIANHYYARDMKESAVFTLRRP